MTALNDGISNFIGGSPPKSRRVSQSGDSSLPASGKLNWIRHAAGRSCKVAEGIVNISIGQSAGGVAQRGDGTQAIGFVKAGRAGTKLGQRLVDAQPLRVVGNFSAREVKFFDQIIAVVDIRARSAG